MAMPIGDIIYKFLRLLKQEHDKEKDPNYRLNVRSVWNEMFHMLKERERKKDEPS
jgi:hypothetical protein